MEGVCEREGGVLGREGRERARLEERDQREKEKKHWDKEE